jgi:hypothetical protein
MASVLFVSLVFMTFVCIIIDDCKRHAEFSQLLLDDIKEFEKYKNFGCTKEVIDTKYLAFKA